MNEYLVLASLGTEVLFVKAEDETKALNEARNIIEDIYNNKTLAYGASYQVERRETE